MNAEFLRGLYGNGEGYYVVWAKEAATPIKAFEYTEKGIREGLGWLRRVALISNVYVSRGLLEAAPARGERGKAGDVVAQRVLTLDLDFGTEGHAGKKYPPTAEDALSLLEGMPEPSFILHTGNGFLVGYTLDRAYNPRVEPVALTAKAIETAVQLKAKERGWAVDTTSDLPRPIRVPGSFNRKDRMNPKPVRFIKEGGPVYTLGDFAGYLPLVARQPKERRTDLQDGSLPVELVREMLAVIPNEGLDYNVWLGLVWTVQSLFDEDTAAALLDEWGTENWEQHGNEDAEPAVGLLIKTAREYGWTGKLPQPGLPPVEQVALPNSVVVEQEFLNVPMPASKIVLVRSPKGTGKTEWLTRAIPQDASLLVVGHRVSLLRQQAERLGAAHYQDGKGDLSDPRLAVTLHSLMRVSPEAAYSYVVLDESEQVLSAYVTDKNLRDRKDNSLTWLIELVRRADKLVLLDADLGPVTLAFLKAVFGDELNVTSIVNTVKKPLGAYVALHPTFEEALAGLVGAVKAGMKVAVACNTKADALLIDELLRKEVPGTKGFAVTAEDSNSAEGQDFINNINDRVTALDWLVYSPSLGTGVSVDEAHFDLVYFFGRNSKEGTGTHLDLLQQIARVRKTTSGELYGWVEGRNYNEPTDPEIYRTWALKNAEEVGLRLGIKERRVAVYGEVDALYLELYATVKAAHAASKNYFRANFQAALVAEGYEVEEAAPEDAELVKGLRATIRESKKAAKVAKAEEVVNAKAMDAGVGEALKNKRNLTKDEWASLQKTSLMGKYGLTEDDVTVELVQADERGLFQKVRRLAGVLDEQYAARLDRIEVNGPEFGERGSARMAPDRNNWTLQCDLLREGLTAAGIHLTGDTTGEVKPGVEFIAWAKGNAERIERVLGVQVRRDVEEAPRKFLAVLLDLVGLKLSSKQTRVSGKMGRVYTLDQERLAQLRGFAEHRLEVEKPIKRASAGFLGVR